MLFLLLLLFLLPLLRGQSFLTECVGGETAAAVGTAWTTTTFRTLRLDSCP